MLTVAMFWDRTIDFLPSQIRPFPSAQLVGCLEKLVTGSADHTSSSEESKKVISQLLSTLSSSIPKDLSAISQK
jgi:hypothetical protein